MESLSSTFFSLEVMFGVAAGALVVGLLVAIYIKANIASGGMEFGVEQVTSKTKQEWERRRAHRIDTDTPIDIHGRPERVPQGSNRLKNLSLTGACVASALPL